MARGRRQRDYDDDEDRRNIRQGRDRRYEDEDYEEAGEYEERRSERRRQDHDHYDDEHSTRGSRRSRDHDDYEEEDYQDDRGSDRGYGSDYNDDDYYQRNLGWGKGAQDQYGDDSALDSEGGWGGGYDRREQEKKAQTDADAATDKAKGGTLYTVLSIVLGHIGLLATPVISIPVARYFTDSDIILGGLCLVPAVLTISALIFGILAVRKGHKLGIAGIVIASLALFISLGSIAITWAFPMG